MQELLSFLVFLQITAVCVARGPHHPKNSHMKLKTDKHFHHEKEHIQEDLTQFTNKKITDMTEDEKNFYYFKLHDLDDNNHLDGLEMLNAATHHKHDGIKKLQEKSENEEDGLNHIIEVIDDFIDFADLDKNGLLNYPEYIRAITNTATNETVEES
ncbi:multiple coagulation factor deficiency protein 2 homolog [Culicoides brevitarsis]|uniref:multiple coagulation factor deficiency protein 2 homolog n=1 Tax=Culicoides brevitarsis TaxID=469753 RepID=UPI00307CBEE6